MGVAAAQLAVIDRMRRRLGLPVTQLAITAGVDRSHLSWLIRRSVILRQPVNLTTDYLDQLYGGLAAARDVVTNG